MSLYAREKLILELGRIKNKCNGPKDESLLSFVNSALDNLRWGNPLKLALFNPAGLTALTLGERPSDEVRFLFIPRSNLSSSTKPTEPGEPTA